MAKQSIHDILSAFSERYYTWRLPASVVAEFGEILRDHIARIRKAADRGANEEAIKSIINRFLGKYFFPEKDDFEIIAEGRIDSVIKHEEKILALFEAKRPAPNLNEMAREDDLNHKALWELVYYYLGETRDVSGRRIKRIKDAEIRRLVISDGLRWFLFDAVDIEKLCDGYLEKHYSKYRNSQLPYANDNAKFYEGIKSHFDKIDVTLNLNYLYLDFEEIYSQRKNWQYLYKILRPDFFSNLAISKR